ncbi:hypothetical protein IU433_12230 [Nocardia puris]|uniref:hypothetical protein n=1 Tax=Nocardia puris TaxID=208602 RepID=UPI00189410C6|nr:hypothetical protein [Nocardia puris]MBF6459804.1 hypothetical protein [Nocardia puris]
MTQPIVFPAIEIPLIDHLAAGYAAHGIDLPVVGEVPAQRPARFVRVGRIGGPLANLGTDNPRIAVEYWAELGTAAAELAAIGRALVGAVGGTAVGEMWVDRVVDRGLSYLPDEATRTPRYVSYHELWVPGLPLTLP